MQTSAVTWRRSLLNPSWMLICRASSSTSGTRPSGRRRRSRVIENAEGEDLIGPPDPVSNIRPIIYASTSSARRQTPNSPYSTFEFPVDGQGGRLAELELEWRLRRERVDAVNHRFWATTNQQFNAQMEHRLSLLPVASDPPTKEDEKRREDCLDQFYADWQASQRERMNVWVKGWWRDVWDGVWMAGKIKLAQLRR